MRKTILLLLLIISGYVSAREQSHKFNGKIYALITADTEDEDIGRSVQVDIDCIGKSISTIGNGINFDIQTILLKGRKCSYRSIFRELKNISSSSQDIIIFYYSGHGYNNPLLNTPWPLLYTKGQEVEGNKVRALLNNKTKRSAIILFDCCNSVDDVEKALFVTRRLAPPFFLKKSDNLNAFFKLLLGFKGTITLCAASVGETAGCKPRIGSYFTRGFLKAVHELGSKEAITWDQLYKLGVDKTLQIADRRNQEHHPICSIEQE